MESIIWAMWGLQGPGRGRGGVHRGTLCLVRLSGRLYLLELPPVGHGGHHLCELLLLALQHAVHVLHRSLREGTGR